MHDGIVMTSDVTDDCCHFTVFDIGFIYLGSCWGKAHLESFNGNSNMDSSK